MIILRKENKNDKKITFKILKTAFGESTKIEKVCLRVRYNTSKWANGAESVSDDVDTSNLKNVNVMELPIIPLIMTMPKEIMRDLLCYLTKGE